METTAVICRDEMTPQREDLESQTAILTEDDLRRREECMPQRDDVESMQTPETTGQAEGSQSSNNDGAICGDALEVADE